MVPRVSPVFVLLWPMMLLSACDPQEGEVAPSATTTPGEDPPAEEPARPLRDAATAARHREQALTHRGAGRLPEALAAFGLANAADPLDRQIAREYAELLTASILQADPAKALAVLAVACGDGPVEPDLLLLQARAAFRAGDDSARQKARALLGHGGANQVQRGEAHSILGMLAEENGDFEGAARAFRAAIQEVPPAARYHCRLGAALEEAGSPEDAQKALQRATSLDPGLAEAHFLLARLHRRAGRADQAEHETQIHYWLNRYRDSMARTEEAYLDRIKCLEELAAIYPEYLEGRLTLAELLILSGRNRDSAETSRALIADRPMLDRAYGLHVEALRREHGDEKARKELQRLLQEVPGIPVARRQQILRIVLEGFSK